MLGPVVNQRVWLTKACATCTLIFSLTSYFFSLGQKILAYLTLIGKVQFSNTEQLSNLHQIRRIRYNLRTNLKIFPIRQILVNFIYLNIRDNFQQNMLNDSRQIYLKYTNLFFKSLYSNLRGITHNQ